MNQSRRAISKEGPAPLRLAFYQAGSVARTMDPQLAAFYHRLMTEHGHCHTQATIAVARKLAERTWKTLTTGQMYELRDLEGPPVTKRAPREHRVPLHRHAQAAHPVPVPHDRSETGTPDTVTTRTHRYHLTTSRRPLSAPSASPGGSGRRRGPTRTDNATATAEHR